MQDLKFPRSPRQRLPALRTFEAVSRHLSVTRAAEELFVTPGAVSQQVRGLEEAMGVTLLERHHRRVALTFEGAKLSQCLTSCFERIDRTLLELAGNQESHRLTLLLMPTFAIRWLVPRLSAFYGQHPGIELDMSTISGPEDTPLINVDFAVRLGTGSWADAESDLLFSDALLPVCTPQMARKLKKPSDMQKFSLLHSKARPEGWHEWLEGRGCDADDYRKHMRFANGALACQAALDGLGIACTQREYVEGDIALGNLVAPFPSFGREGLGYYLVCPTYRANWPDVQRFRQWITSVAKR